MPPSKGQLKLPYPAPSHPKGGKGNKQPVQVLHTESDDEDDDSPYFVKITLDEMFLSHL